MIETPVHYASCSEDDDLACLQEREAQLLFFPRVPCRDQIGESGIDSGHGHAEQDSQCDHLFPCCDECRAESDYAEADCDGGEVDSGAYHPDQDRRG